MILEISKWIVLFFGFFIIFIMLLNPKKARETLRKAGSTNFISYAVMTSRLIPAIALILYADLSKYPKSLVGQC